MASMKGRTKQQCKTSVKIGSLYNVPAVQVMLPYPLTPTRRTFLMCSTALLVLLRYEDNVRFGFRGLRRGSCAIRCDMTGNLNNEVVRIDSTSCLHVQFDCQGFEVEFATGGVHRDTMTDSEGGVKFQVTRLQVEPSYAFNRKAMLCLGAAWHNRCTASIKGIKIRRDEVRRAMRDFP